MANCCDLPAREAGIVERADADRDIHAVLDQVAELVGQAHVGRQPRMTQQEPGQGRQHDSLAEGHGDVDAQFAPWFSAGSRRERFQFVDLREDPFATGKQRFAVRGQRNLPRRAMEKLQSEPFFEADNAFGNSGRRHTQFPGGDGEAAVACGTGEGKELAESAYG